MTGDLRAALEMLRPHLGPGADPVRTGEAFRAAALVWCDAIDRDEARRQKFEARVAVKIAEFEKLLEDRTERNLRIRFMRLQIEELRRAHDELRDRLSLRAVVWESDAMRAESNERRFREWKERKKAFFEERDAARARGRKA